MRNRRTLHPAMAACALIALLCCAGADSSRSVAVAAPSAPARAAAGAQQAQVPLPNKENTLHFAVIGDNGDGEREQYEIGEQMLKWYGRFEFPLVVMMGDNIYGSDRPQDFVNKFEAPYKGLLDKSVKFYASLGNHDSREQRYYKLYNMDGKLYYTFKAPKEDVRFFALESTYVGQDARLAAQAARGPGAALHPVQGQPRPERPRSRLRADRAAERDSVLRGRILRQAAGRRSAQGLAAHRLRQRRHPHL